MPHLKHQIPNHGMSLVELVLVICIISIFAAVAAIPFSRATTEAQLINAADRLITDLTLVRDQARKEQKPYTLIFSADNTSYRATGVADLIGTNQIVTNLIDDQYQLTHVNVNLDDSTKSITYNALGFTSVTGEIILFHGSRAITIKIFKNGKITRTEPH